MLVGNEARKLKSKEWTMESLEWLVQEFGLCHMGSTDCQQRFFLEVKFHNQIFCRNITHVSVWWMIWRGETLDAWRPVRVQVHELCSRERTRAHLLICDIYDVFIPLCNPRPLCVGWT